MKEEPCECKAGAPEWMVTFADLMSLLLTFFVLLLSFSHMEVIKFREMSSSMRDAFGLKSRLDLSDVPMGQHLLPYEDPKEGDGGEGPTAEEIVRQLEAMLEEAGIQQNGEAKVDKHGVVLQLQGDLLFASGRAELKDKAHPVVHREIREAGTAAGSREKRTRLPAGPPAFPLLSRCPCKRSVRPG